MTKADLENRMVVEYADGCRRLVVDNILMGHYAFALLEKYKEDLTLNDAELSANPYENRAINKVFEKVKRLDDIENPNLKLLWERKE